MAADRDLRKVRASAVRTVLMPAKIAVRPALAAGSGVKQMLRYWAAERVTLRQGMIALTVSALGSIPAGLTLGAMDGQLAMLPGLVILIPGAIGMRGAIFGALASRLGTGLASGLLTFDRDKDGLLMQNARAAILQSLTSSLYLALAARAFSAITGLPSIPLWDLVLISVLGGMSASAIILVLTIQLAKQGDKRGWDLDAVAAPIVTFLGDFITLPTLALATLLAQRGLITDVLGISLTIVSLAAAVASFRAKRPITRRIIRESALTLLLAGAIDIVAGVAIEHRIDRFISFPALLVMLPAFLENAGALGGIVSSRLSSKLHFGAIRPRAIPDRLAALDITLAAPWALVNFAMTGVVAHLTAIALGKNSPGAWTMVVISLVGGLMATAGAALIAYLTAVATFRLDLDPDNHGIAAVTSTMDLIGVMCIVAAATITGAGI
jgi:mgtE-like transporter